MHKKLVMAVLIMGLVPFVSGAEDVWLSALDISKTQQDWGQPHADKSVKGNPLSIGGVKFEHGLGTHAQSTLCVNLKGGATRFTAAVGVDDEETGKGGSVEFEVIGDGRTLWESGVLKQGQPAKELSVDLTGVKTLLLVVTNAAEGIDFDHADWANAKITMREGRPETVDAPREEAVILTPQPGPAPRINGAKIYGCRPGHPFLYRIPSTGDRPMMFAATGLPNSLELDAATGIITGNAPARGEYVVTFRAKNANGKAERKFKIVSGGQIALTPSLGWNSWNCFACDVTADNVKGAADAMVASGLVNHGWNQINIDDCWEAGRDERGNICSNKKFPDMKALADYVHGKGLKIGLYSSPGPKTCAGYTASYQHEEQDARQWADWGFDYIKYDWCSYHNVQNKSLPDRERLMLPYQVMRAALDKVPRDIIFSLCQYGMGNVWEWGGEVGGNSWRTTGDITDTWKSLSTIGFNQAGHEKFAGPGHWNDPDMLVVGKVGWSRNLRPTRLTPSEQYTHISLWCLLCSPLLIGCDMTQLDDFTLNLLTNDEVLEVSQDPLGRQAARVAKAGNLEVWTKDMEDGSQAVGLFNRGEMETPVTVKWSDLGLAGKQHVRDLWRQKDLGAFDGEFTAKVSRHGVVLVRVSPTGK